MKERPILFNTAMVQAILSGRKTQTRRQLSDRHSDYIGINGDVAYGSLTNHTGRSTEPQWYLPSTEGATPLGQLFGAIGDRLWVREAFGDCGARLTYKADADDGAHCMVKRWIPSIHMPRSACRIILEITELRVERLNDISAEDCAAEGHPLKPEASDDKSVHEDAAKDWFIDIWNSTGGDWNANPWVWVIEFKVLTVNGVVPEVAA